MRRRVPRVFRSHGDLFAAAASGSALLANACGGSNADVTPHVDASALDAPGDTDTGRPASEASAPDAGPDAAVDAGPVMAATITVNPTATLGAIGRASWVSATRSREPESRVLPRRQCAARRDGRASRPERAARRRQLGRRDRAGNYDAGAPAPDAAAPAVITRPTSTASPRSQRRRAGRCSTA